jgi:hypothetical protein
MVGTENEKPYIGDIVIIPDREFIAAFGNREIYSDTSWHAVVISVERENGLNILTVRRLDDQTVCEIAGDKATWLDVEIREFNRGERAEIMVIDKEGHQAKRKATCQVTEKHPNFASFYNVFNNDNGQRQVVHAIQLRKLVL